MRRSARAVVVTILALLASIALAAASALMASTTLAATVSLLVPGTGTPNSNIVEDYNTNARDYYMDPFSGCTIAADCAVQGINYPAQFFPLPFPGWGGLLGEPWNESVATGLNSLNNTTTLQLENTDDDIVLFGYSQGARVVSLSKQFYLANLPFEEDLDRFEIVLIGNISRPNGGLWTRFGTVIGFIPILDISFGDPTPTDVFDDSGCSVDTPDGCATTDIALRYDGVSNFPNYLGNLTSVLNAVAGFAYIHGSYLAPNGGSDPADRLPGGALSGQGYTPAELADQLDPAQNPDNFATFGDTLYATIPLAPTTPLPILMPLAIVAQDVPALEPVITPVMELLTPVLTWEIDNGYDPDINPGEPTGIKLFRLPFADYDPLVELTEFVDVVAQGIADATDGVDPAWAPSTASAAVATVESDAVSQAEPIEVTRAIEADDVAVLAALEEEVQDETGDPSATSAIRSGNKFAPVVAKVEEVIRTLTGVGTPAPSARTTVDDAEADEPGAGGAGDGSEATGGTGSTDTSPDAGATGDQDAAGAAA